MISGHFPFYVIDFARLPPVMRLVSRGWTGPKISRLAFYSGHSPTDRLHQKALGSKEASSFYLRFHCKIINSLLKPYPYTKIKLQSMVQVIKVLFRNRPKGTTSETFSLILILLSLQNCMFWAVKSTFPRYRVGISQRASRYEFQLVEKPALFSDFWDEIEDHFLALALRNST